MKKEIYILILLFLSFYLVTLEAQFAPAAGKEGSTAIHKDSSAIVTWANACTVDRGFIKISDSTLMYDGSNRASHGAPSDAIDEADGRVVSLGDSGTAILSFEMPVTNGPGPDFAVFENGFQAQEPPQHYFLELAFVEVSSDGKQFVRFPAVSNTPVAPQMDNFGQMDPTLIHNLAGKYAVNYGTPFDLDDIKDSANIDISEITHIKILDVTGSVKQTYASFDSDGNVINDPWPTPFATGGFDLDAVAALHLLEDQQTGSVVHKTMNMQIYPNPVKPGHTIRLHGIPEPAKTISIKLMNVTGTMVLQKDIKTIEFPKISVHIPDNTKSGWYIIQLTTNNKLYVSKLMIRE